MQYWFPSEILQQLYERGVQFSFKTSSYGFQWMLGDSEAYGTAPTLTRAVEALAEAAERFEYKRREERHHRAVELFEKSPQKRSALRSPIAMESPARATGEIECPKCGSKIPLSEWFEGVETARFGCGFCGAEILIERESYGKFSVSGAEAGPKQRKAL